MRTVVYTRISLDRTGESLGVQRQEQQCRELADSLGWQVTAVYTDNDISATSGKRRPGFEALLSAMAGGEVDAVLTWHPDRLYRKLSDLTRLLDVAKGVEFRTVTAGQMDLSTPTGRMMAGILGSVATGEVEHKAVRQRAAARQLAESGRPKWRRAFGYLETPDGPVPDPKVAPLVKQAYSAVLAGASLNDVCKLWNEAGALTVNGKQWTAPQVSVFLRKPRNAGLRTYQAKRGKADRATVTGAGTWAPLIDPDLFWSVQAVMDDDRRKPGKKSVQKHLLTGVMHCGGCGEGRLGGHWVAQRAGGYTLAYNCKRCRRCGIRAHQVEPLLYAAVAERLSRPDAVNLLKAQQHDSAEAERLRVEAATLHAKTKQLGVDYAEGLLTAAQVRAATEVIEAKLAENTRAQQDSERLRVFDGIPVGTDDVDAAVLALSADRFRAVLSVLCDITVAPVGRGHRTAAGDRFDKERVKVVWHE